MRHFVTGAAGFIGSTLVDRLLADGHTVVGYDNFSTGQERFLEGAVRSERFTLVRADLLDPFTLTKSMAGAERVWHFAANADVRFGTNHPRRDLEQNTISTSNVLEAMRVNGVRDIAFSSTGSVYGEAATIPTPEDAPFPIQTSLYGASKLAGEGLIAAYAEGFGMRAVIFRFVSILGERYTHGHVFDFLKHLHRDPTRLRILGNGLQRKSYLYVQDCINAMQTAWSVAERSERGVAIYNLGTDEYCQVNDSAGWIAARIGASPTLEHTGGERGWIGDNPFIFLDASRIKAQGWKAQLSIRQAVERTVDWLQANRWVMEARS
jgi:UDP-glucose 4-epimerase